MKKLLRGISIAVLGAASVVVVSAFLLFSQAQVQATIYWHGCRASDVFFFDKLTKLGYNAVFGGPVTLNGQDGHFVIFRTGDSVSNIQTALTDQLPSADGMMQEWQANTSFVLSSQDSRTMAAMLLRDENINQTWIFSVTMPEAFFKTWDSEITDAHGIDPVPDLRPPGSKRVFSFETDAIAFTAYESMLSDLRDHFDTMFAGPNYRAISIMAFADQQLPDNGNFVFFDGPMNEGFVVYQSDLTTGGSYAIVCAMR